MALITSLFKVLLISSLSIQVQAHDCHIGQEPTSKNGHRWYIAERNPCDCTDFRLGGWNNKAQPHPSGVGGIHNVPFKTNKEKIREILGCEDASAEMDDSPCDRFTTRHGDIEKVTRLVLPMEMELTIDTPEGVTLYFDNQTPTITGSKYSVEVGPGFHAVINFAHGLMHGQTDTSTRNFTGSAVMITFDGMSISVGLKGIPESFISHNPYNSAYMSDEWFIGLYSNSDGTVWSFYKPCDLFNN